MARLIIGIDNGLDGGVVTLNEIGSVEFSEVMPVIGASGKGKRAYDIPGMIRAVRGFAPDTERVVFLESAQAMPFQGVVSTFSTGFGFGIWQGILTSLGIPYHVVRPQKWQGVMFEGIDRTDTKRASATIAARLQPNVDWRASERNRIPHDGKTDAFCIAEYGRRSLNSNA